MPDLMLYGTLGCHLCEEAQAWLQHFFPALQLIHVDIAVDERLVEEFGLRIPVLSNGRESLDWPFQVAAVMALIENADPEHLAQQMTQEPFIKPAKSRRVLRLASAEK
ncbi:hypothetical protein MAQ5080_02042 [Marinomonas aquimarina]|uniref:Glutaredoxin-like domain (DUF836) n=1 Tax=Marinomonas aquimarina TaxID=295068 RepID=A0A1A8TH95_9GAMM|nr:glutaredoxin family protein [Marinomonas aquimarina]SBS31700.1 hypothetical protein MAQ5080_02042 [Marinomonas aquimarina]